MTSTTDWLPVGRDIATQRAGIHWDAVRIGSALGETILRLLGDRTGAVIEDTWGRTMYWLVPAGTAAAWDVPGSVALGIACWVTVPGPAAEEIRWRVPTTAQGGVLTGPRLLADALAAARTREPAS